MKRKKREPTPDEELGERLRIWREEYARDENGKVGLSLRKLQKRLEKHADKGSQIPTYVTLRDWEQSPAPKPNATTLQAYERAFPELRLRWLMFGEGHPTKSGEQISEALRREGDRDARLRQKAFQRLGNLQALDPETRGLFRRLVADWIQSTPDSGRVLDSEDDVRALTAAAGALERVIRLLFWYLGPWGRGGRDAETDPDEYATWFTSMLFALRPVLTGEMRRERPLSDPDQSPVALLADDLWYFQDELDELEVKEAHNE